MQILRAGIKTPREPRCERQAAGSQERRRRRIHSDTPRRSDAGDGGLAPQPEGLGGFASPRCVARRRRSTPPATPPPRALRGWQLRPARPRGVLIPALTLNTWGHHGPPERIPLLRKTLGSLHPEILCLQETPDKGFLSTLASDLGAATCFHAPESGLGILSRFPALTHRIVTYRVRSALETYCRQALLAQLDLGSQSLWVITTHLAWIASDETTRCAQVEELLTLAKPLGDSVLLGGDFNTPPNAPSIQRIREAGFLDLFGRLHPREPGITWDNQNLFIQSHSVKFQDRRIDYLFLNKKGGERFSPADCEVVCRTPTADGIYPSDHYGVMALFRQ